MNKTNNNKKKKHYEKSNVTHEMQHNKSDSLPKSFVWNDAPNKFVKWERTQVHKWNVSVR